MEIVLEQNVASSELRVFYRQSCTQFTIQISSFVFCNWLWIWFYYGSC